MSKRGKVAHGVLVGSIFKVFSIALIIMGIFGGLFSQNIRAGADTILVVGQKTVVYKVESSTYTYNFSSFGANNLPPEFGRVISDGSTTLSYGVHPDRVNYFYTKIGSDGYERAVYCFEPNNPYMSVGEGYDIHANIPEHSKQGAISQEQRDMLAYVMAAGASQHLANHEQVATQLAIWMIGAGHYKGQWLYDLLPATSASDTSFGIAPNAWICARARELIRIAQERVDSEPSFVKGASLKMTWNGTDYSITLKDEKNKLKNGTEWGNVILDQLLKAGFVGSINDTNHTLTITGDPTAAGKSISLILTTAKKGDVVFLDDKILPGDGSTHTYFKSRQEMITLRSLENAEVGNFRLTRDTNTSFTITATKAVSGVSSTNQQFTFTLTQLGSSTVTDILAGGITQTKSITGAGTVTFNSISLEAGTYYFKVQETSGGNGWINDTTARVVRVEIIGGAPSVANITYLSGGGATFTNYAPSISTTAKAADGTKIVEPNTSVTIEDTVSYRNLDTTKQYTITGILMDKATNQPLKVGGVEITATKTFTPQTKDGDVKLSFTFNASALNGTSVVVFEKLMLGATEVAKHEDINDQAQTVLVKGEPSIATTAKNTVDGTSIVPAGTNVSITDTVTYKNLDTTKTYVISGILMDKATNQPLKVGGVEITATKTFTPQTANGSVELVFTLNSTSLHGTSVVVFETLSHNGTEVTKHADINDQAQTVLINGEPSIATTAKNTADGTSIVPAGSNVSITDTVTYKNLDTTKTYVISGILMDKATNQPLKVGGVEITATKTFTPQTANGSVELEFTLDSTLLHGTSVVVFETLSHNETEVTKHADINDQGQTVLVKGEPGIKTSARNEYDRTQVVRPNSLVTIIDSVTYSNLDVGKTYKIDGIIMVKGTELPLLIGGNTVVASTTFTPDTPNGTINLPFTFNAFDLAGETLVVFETLSHNGVDVVVHADINDADQTIEIGAKPGIGTTATNASNGAKTFGAQKDIVIVDLLKYTNLDTNLKYTVVGILMDKDLNAPLLVDGNQVTEIVEFTPSSSSGSIELTFELDATDLAGKTIVVFEEIFVDSIMVAVHTDINNESQTVRVRNTPRTGVEDYQMLWMSIIAISSVSMLGVALPRRKRKTAY